MSMRLSLVPGQFSITDRSWYILLEIEELSENAVILLK